MESPYSTDRTTQKKTPILPNEFEASGLGLDNVFAQTPGAILFVDRQGHIENMNQAAQNLLGELGGSLSLRKWPEKLGLYLDDGVTTYPSESIAPVRALQGESIEDQEMILRKDAEAGNRWISMSAMPFEEDGHLLGAVTVIRDITYRKRVEHARQVANEALDISEGRFRAIFEGTAQGIKILDVDGIILQTNPAFQRITGYSEAELVGRNFEELLAPQDARRASWILGDLERNATTGTRFEHRIHRKDGTPVWLNTVFTKITKGRRDNSSAFVVGIVEDITAQKRMEQEMEELNNRLRTGYELERLRLAHELHDGPMQEVYTAIYRLGDLRTKAAPRMQEALDEISRDLQGVIHSLRSTTTELRPPALSAFGLEKAIRSHAEDFQERHPDVIVELSLSQDRQLLPEEVRLALFRVLQQALANVARHSQATHVRVKFAFDAEDAQLEISDDGIGFEKPASLVKFLREGHYGLAGAAERIRAQAGSLTVESKPGEGTTIRAVIPWGRGED